jgi:hypothetical protein
MGIMALLEYRYGIEGSKRITRVKCVKDEMLQFC